MPTVEMSTNKIELVSFWPTTSIEAIWLTLSLRELRS